MRLVGIDCGIRANQCSELPQFLPSSATSYLWFPCKIEARLFYT